MTAMRTTHLLALTLAMAVFAGCDGVQLVNLSADDPNAPAWTQDSNLEARVLGAADIAIRIWGWGGVGLSELDGYTIEIRPNHDEPGGKGRRFDVGRLEPNYLWGFILLGGGMLWIWDGTGQPCIETSVLAHEIGHLHHRGHDDWRWRDKDFWDAMAEALLANVPPEDTECRAALISDKGQALWH